jgi:MYXO-CTERM domain-containing protein
MKKLVATAAVFGLATVAGADFSGFYDPGNWTFAADDDGYVDTSGAPAQIALYGTNSGGFSSFTTLTIATPAAGTFSFDWNFGTFDTPGYDEVGYVINGTYYFLDDGYGPGSGSVSVAVNAGDVIGWYVESYDGCCGESYIEVYNFSGPIPAPGALALLGLAGLASRRRR